MFPTTKRTSGTHTAGPGSIAGVLLMTDRNKADLDVPWEKRKLLRAHTKNSPKTFAGAPSQVTIACLSVTAHPNCQG